MDLLGMDWEWGKGERNGLGWALAGLAGRAGLGLMGVGVRWWVGA